MGPRIDRGLLASASWLAIGSAAAQVVNAVAIPVLARVFAPGALGMWAVMQSYTLTASTLAGLRYELALPVAREDRAARAAQLQLALTAVVTAGMVVWFAFRLPADLEIARSEVGLGPVLLGVAALVGGGAVFQLVCQNSIREARFGALAFSRFISSAGATLAQLLLGLLTGGRAAALMLGTALATALAGAVGAPGLRRLLSGRAPGPARLVEVAREFRQFPLFVVPYGLVTLARDRGLLLLLAAYLDLTLVGIVAMAQRVVSLPVGLAATAVGPVLHRRLALADRPADGEPMVLQVLVLMIWLGMPVFLALALLADDLAPMLLGQGWDGVGAFCAVLATSGFTLFLSGVFDRSFDIVHKQSRALWIEGANSAVSLGVAWLLLSRGASPVAALLGFALANVAHHVVWVLAAWLALGFSRTGLARLGLHASGAMLLALVAWSLSG